MRTNFKIYRMIYAKRVPVMAAGLPLIVDVVTKHIAQTTLSNGRKVHFSPDLTLRLFYNPGASLGIGSSHPAIVSFVVVIVTAGLAYWSFTSRSRAIQKSMAITVGGSIGNLVDRIFRPPYPFGGPVIDWISIGNSSIVFNLADVFIRAGLLITVVILLLQGNLPWKRGAIGVHEASSSELASRVNNQNR